MATDIKLFNWSSELSRIGDILLDNSAIKLYAKGGNFATPLWIWNDPLNRIGRRYVEIPYGVIGTAM